MPLDRDIIKGTLQVDDMPENLCWGKPQDFVNLLTRILSIVLPISPANQFVIVSHLIPGEDDKGKLWVRLAPNGSFLGFYLFQTGSWKRIFNLRDDQINWFEGTSAEIPPGFRLIDGTVPGIDASTQTHIMKMYEIDPTIPSPVTYKYFACIWEGF